jgi:phosphoribosyl 1,2-cyclic phosphodiesterase
MKFLEITTLASSSAGNCHLINDGKTKMLLDAGIPIKRIKEGLGFQCSSIAGALITHEHQDHIKACNDLADIGVRCYATKGTFEAAGVRQRPFVEPIKKLETFSVGTFQIMAFPIDHDAADPVGYLVSSKHSGAKLLYITDTYKVNYSFGGVTHLMIECNYTSEDLRQYAERSNLVYLKRIYSSHMELETVVLFIRSLQESPLQEVHLLHLSDNNADEEKMKSRIQEVTGAIVKVVPKWI